MIVDEETKEKASHLRLRLARAIGHTACDFFGNKLDEDGFTLEGEQIDVFLKALGPLFVHMATSMGMSTANIVEAVMCSCAVLDASEAH